MLGHVAVGYLEGNTYPEVNQVLYGVKNAIYAFHMPLFMMISGCVYAVAYYRDGEPSQKRIHRQIGNIIFVYVLFSVIFGLMKIIFQSHTVNETTSKDILLIWAKPIKLYWYLYDLAIFYLLFSIPAVFKTDRRKMLCLLAAATVLSQCITLSWFQVHNCLYYALFFYLGISNKRYPNRLVGNKSIAITSFVVSMLLCVVFWDRVPYNDAQTHFSLNSVPVANAVIALGISLFLWYLFQHVKLLSTNRILMEIGKYSWEIYVIHGIVSPTFRAVVSHISWIDPYASVAINTALCIALPIAFSLCCKKLGVHELLFRPVPLNRMKTRWQKA